MPTDELLEGQTDSGGVSAAEAGQPGESSAPPGASEGDTGLSDLSPEAREIAEGLLEAQTRKYEGPEGDIAATKRAYAAKEREDKARIAELEASVAQQSDQHLERALASLEQGDVGTAQGEIQAIRQEMAQQRGAAGQYSEWRQWASEAIGPLGFDMDDPENRTFVDDWVVLLAQDPKRAYEFQQDAAVRRLEQKDKASKALDKRVADLEANEPDKVQAGLQRALAGKGAVPDAAGPGGKVKKNPLEGQTAPGPLLEDAFADLTASLEDGSGGRP